jgi:hypothetical protein
MVKRNARFSDDTSEYMWTDFIIDVNCIYNPGATSYSSATIQQPGNLPMTTDSAIRFALMQPRQYLLFEEGGQTILFVTPNLPSGGAIDCENGPIPQFVDITRIGSSRIFYINYVIKASVIECPIGAFISPIASNRYSRTETIDNQYRSTIITSGITYFRSNVLEALGQDADSFRGYIVPPLLLGYKRMNLSFELSADGITLRWSTTDVEQFQDIGDLATPGSAASVGITEMGLTYQTGQFQQGSMGLAGFGSLCNVRCWARGLKGADRFAMIQFIFRVAWDKLTNVVPIGMLRSCELTEDVFNQYVELNMSYMVLDDSVGFPDAYLPITGVVGNTILIASLPNLGGVNPQPPFSKGTRGTAAYMLAVNSFAKACYTSLGQISADDSGTILPPDAYSQVVPYGDSPSVTGYYDPGNPAPNTTSPSIRQQGNPADGALGNKNIHTSYEVKESSFTNKGLVQAPTAMASANVTLPPGTPTSVILQLFQPISRKVVEWKAERIGAIPIIPDPTISTGSQYYGKLVLMSHVKSPIGIEAMPDAYTKIYRISGVYTYASLVPLGDTESLSFAIPPWLNLQTDQTTQLTQNEYAQGIINNQVQSTGGTVAFNFADEITSENAFRDRNFRQSRGIMAGPGGSLTI